MPDACRTIIEVPCPLGRLALRPERPQDQAFRFALFCSTRQPEWQQAPLPQQLREALERQQFQAQTLSYAQSFPQARFDIVELAGEPIGRIVVDRPGDRIALVDQAIVPLFRSRGVGTAIMRALMDEAAAGGMPLRLMVSGENAAALRLYRRLGFRPIGEANPYLELEWRGQA
jgi:ribosomal protein S18 acetylase RimI-like enzyme